MVFGSREPRNERFRRIFVYCGTRLMISIHPLFALFVPSIHDRMILFPDRVAAFAFPFFFFSNLLSALMLTLNSSSIGISNVQGIKTYWSLCMHVIISVIIHDVKFRKNDFMETQHKAIHCFKEQINQVRRTLATFGQAPLVLSPFDLCTNYKNPYS